MNELELPNRFEGPWEHILILTYGADFQFFESRAIWRQISNRCRNRVVMADGATFLESCSTLANQPDRLHRINKEFVADGIFGFPASHGKVVLLTNDVAGRLIVGSGNLGHQGYASGGEIFCEYTYSAEDRSGISAFLTIKEIIETLLQADHLEPNSRRHVDRMLQSTPWLYQSAPDSVRPVRHNLMTSFIDQLSEEISSRVVEELWVLSPFYDAECRALDRLLEITRPKTLYVLLQRARTSLNPRALASVIEKHALRSHVLYVSRGEDNPYLHAKLYLMKLENSSICLQGSPNLSWAAMVLTAGPGNLEIANLLDGPRDAIDHILNNLDIEEVGQAIELLDLSLAGDRSSPITHENWYLTGGEWLPGRLRLDFRGLLPDLDRSQLIIAEVPFDLVVVSQTSRELRLKVSAEADELLSDPVAVSINWDSHIGPHQTNSVFVANGHALTALLSANDTTELLRRSGDLVLDDDEMEKFFRDLLEVMVVDHQSVWKLFGQVDSQGKLPEGDEQRIDYADVDFEMLRRHPRLRQYRFRANDSHRDFPTSLEMILSAITERFGRLSTPLSRSDSLIPEGSIESEEEMEQQDEIGVYEAPTLLPSVRQRRARILRNFISRFLRGLRSQKYQNLVGPEVIIINSSIFVHILTHLLQREDWLDPGEVVDTLAEAGSLMWDPTSGYYWKLPDETQKEAGTWLRQHYGDAEMLGVIAYASMLSKRRGWHDRRLKMRDIARSLLSSPPMELTQDLAEVMWVVVTYLIPYETPNPTTIIEHLRELLEFETHASMERRVEREFGFPEGSCMFAMEVISDASGYGTRTVWCLKINAGAPSIGQAGAESIVEAWRRFQSLNLYRIHQPSTDEVLVYDVSSDEGSFRDRFGKVVDVAPIAPVSRPWDRSVAVLAELAIAADDEVSGIRLAG
jgi:hypothetical protein